MMGMIEILFWQAGYLFSFRAQEGRLDPLSPLFETIVRSFRVDVQWFNRYVQVTQYLVQNQMWQVPHIGQLRQIASQVGTYVPEPVMALYRRNHEIRQQMANGIGHAARGSAARRVSLCLGQPRGRIHSHRRRAFQPKRGHAGRVAGAVPAVRDASVAEFTWPSA